MKLACKPTDTWQGEQPLLGVPVKLVRFFGCNLGEKCPLDCDTKYSWQSHIHSIKYKVEDVAPSSKYQNLMITGGEPFLQFDKMLLLIKHWFTETNETNETKIIIETNGTVYDKNDLIKLFDVGGSERIFLSVSPKTENSFTNIFDMKIPLFIKHQISFKLVLGKSFPPLNWVEFAQQVVDSEMQVYLMPEGNDQKAMIKNMETVGFIGKLLNYRYILSPRIQYYLEIQ